MICQYCKCSAHLDTSKMIWRCIPCDAYVPCHKPGQYIDKRGIIKISDGTVPFGELANAEYRQAKRDAYDAFDLLWRGNVNEQAAKRRAYKMIEDEIGCTQTSSHISSLDYEQCLDVIKICKKMIKKENS